LSAQSERASIRAQAEKILGSGVLGRSRFYTALLEYLVNCSDRGHVPKEIEIAAEVFNRGEEFDPSQDSMVRVYAHNLRQKLQQYYADHGRAEFEQISIPKGEYRVTICAPGSDFDADDSVMPPAVADRGGASFRIAVAAALSLIAGVVLGLVLRPDEPRLIAEYREVANSPLWAAVTDDELPVTIVVGDYYIFGEIDEFGNVVRMVREFEINSQRDLDDRFMLEPDYAERYIDLDLTYLPTSTAYALRSLMEVLAAAGKSIRVVATSKLETAVIREGHVVYVGYLSSLGMLREFAFSGSGLAIGENFDELVNRATGERYISEAGLPSDAGRYLDYGLFSTLPGPVGNQLVFVAGTRDEGLMQTAEVVTDADLIGESLSAVVDASGAAPAGFELLYEVAGLDRTNLAASIVHATPLPAERVAIGQLDSP
jgi:hypothetical protein